MNNFAIIIIHKISSITNVFRHWYQEHTRHYFLSSRGRWTQSQRNRSHGPEAKQAERRGTVPGRAATVPCFVVSARFRRCDVRSNVLWFLVLLSALSSSWTLQLTCTLILLINICFQKQIDYGLSLLMIIQFLIFFFIKKVLCASYVLLRFLLAQTFLLYTGLYPNFTKNQVHCTSHALALLPLPPM